MLRFDMIICCAIIKPDCIFTNNFFQKGSKFSTWSILLRAITLETTIGGGASEELSLHVQLHVLYNFNLCKWFFCDCPSALTHKKPMVFSHNVEWPACIAWFLPYSTLINLFPTKVVVSFAIVNQKRKRPSIDIVHLPIFSENNVFLVRQEKNKQKGILN